MEGKRGAQGHSACAVKKTEVTVTNCRERERVRGRGRGEEEEEDSEKGSEEPAAACDGQM